MSLFSRNKTKLFFGNSETALTESTYYWHPLMVKFLGTFLHRHRLASMATGLDSHGLQPCLVNLGAAPDKETHC